MSWLQKLLAQRYFQSWFCLLSAVAITVLTGLDAFNPIYQQIYSTAIVAGFAAGGAFRFAENKTQD